MLERAERLERERPVRQETILAEAAQRVRRFSGLGQNQKHPRPLIVMVTKLDAWSSLWSFKEWRAPWMMNSHGSVAAMQLDQIDEISRLLRSLLWRLSPEIVSVAESFASQVLYLPVSATGCSPNRDPKTGQLAFRPRDVKPIWAEVPLLYSMSRWMQGLIPYAKPALARPRRADSRHDSGWAENLEVEPLLSDRPPDRKPLKGRIVSLELVYTSAPRGLAPGSQGFCTVACTRGMTANLTRQLESLSGYRQIYPPQDPRAALNPVAFSHLMLTLAGRSCHVLSRVCDAGLDYTGRTNKFAHHVVLDAAEVPAGGPGWLLAAAGFMRGNWPGEPCVLPAGPALPAANCGAGVPPALSSRDGCTTICRAWQQVAGDAGWGGVLAETVAGGKIPQAVLVFRPGADMLALLAESLALLPAELRWRVTFSTYFTKLPTGVGCQWRCVVDGTPEATAARRGPKSALVIDLCQPLGRAVGGAYVEAARTGKPARAIPAARPPSRAVISRDAADTELEYALQPPSRRCPPQPPARERRPEQRLAIIRLVRPQHLPSDRLPTKKQRFKPKPSSRWPWVLAGIAATLFIFLGGVVTTWLVLRSTTQPSPREVATSAAPQNSTKKQADANAARGPHQGTPKPDAGSLKTAKQPPPGPAPPTSTVHSVVQAKPELKIVTVGPEADKQKNPGPSPDSRKSQPGARIAGSDNAERGKNVDKESARKEREQNKAKARLKRLPHTVDKPPDLPIALSGSPESKMEIIASGDWSLPPPCTVSLLCNDHALGKDADETRLERDSANPATWTLSLIRRGTDQQHEPRVDKFATLKFAPDGLKFCWLPGSLPTDWWTADASKPIALGQVSNCMLELRVGDESRDVLLRPEIPVEDRYPLNLLNQHFDVNPKTKKGGGYNLKLNSRSHELNLPFSPDPAALHVELLDLHTTNRNKKLTTPHFVATVGSKERNVLTVTYAAEFARGNAGSATNDKYRIPLLVQARIEGVQGTHDKVKVVVEGTVPREEWLWNLVKDQLSDLDNASTTPAKRPKTQDSELGISLVVLRDRVRKRLAREFADCKEALQDTAPGSPEAVGANENLNNCSLKRDQVERFLTLASALLDPNTNTELCYRVYVDVKGHQVNLLRRDPREKPKE